MAQGKRSVTRQDRQGSQGRQGTQNKELIGGGLFTNSTITDAWKYFTRLTDFGVEENVATYFYYTSLSPDHKDYMKPSAAAGEFLGNMSIPTAWRRISIAASRAFQMQLNGQAVKEYEKTAAAEESEHQTRPRMPLEDKARAIAEKKLMRLYRTTHDLPERGALHIDQRAKCDEFVKNRIEPATASILKKLEEGIPAKIVQEQEVEPVPA